MDEKYPQIISTPWGELSLVWNHGLLMEAKFTTDTLSTTPCSDAFVLPRFPLLLLGTEFTIQVWKEVQKIPYGTTCTYSDLAKRLNRPSAVRAVASAVARNPLALFIPCHRIVPKSGGWGNYRWGSTRKKAILESEIQK